jgi:hypothetical protein
MKSRKFKFAVGFDLLAELATGRRGGIIFGSNFSAGYPHSSSHQKEAT